MRLWKQFYVILGNTLLLFRDRLTVLKALSSTVEQVWSIIYFSKLCDLCQGSSGHLFSLFSSFNDEKEFKYITINETPLLALSLMISRWKCIGHCHHKQWYPHTYEWHNLKMLEMRITNWITITIVFCFTLGNSHKKFGNNERVW